MLNDKETQKIIDLNTKLLMLENIALSYKDDKKGAKICLKLVKLDTVNLKKSGESSQSETSEIILKYEKLALILKCFARGKNEDAKRHAIDDAEKLIAETKAYLSRLNESVNPFSENVHKLAYTLDDAAQKLSKKLDDGSKIFGEAITNAVTVIKKNVAEIKKNYQENNEKTE